MSAVGIDARREPAAVRPGGQIRADERRDSCLVGSQVGSGKVGAPLAVAPLRKKARTSFQFPCDAPGATSAARSRIRARLASAAPAPHLGDRRGAGFVAAHAPHPCRCLIRVAPVLGLTASRTIRTTRPLNSVLNCVFVRMCRASNRRMVIPGRCYAKAAVIRCFGADALRRSVAGIAASKRSEWVHPIAVRPRNVCTRPKGWSMNPYTTTTRARIQPSDMARALLTDPSMAAISLAILERQRSFQAEAEVAWLLKEHGLAPASIASRLATLRQSIGAALIRAGQRIEGLSPGGVRSENAPAAGTFGTAG